MNKTLYIFLVLLYPTALIAGIYLSGSSGVGALLAALLVCVATGMVVSKSLAKPTPEVGLLAMGCATLATIGLLMSNGAGPAAILAYGATFIVWCRIVSRFKANSTAAR